MARAWLEPPDPGWGPVRLVVTELERLGYVTAEVHGSGQVLIRVAGAELEVSELWVMPPMSL